MRRVWTFPVVLGLIFGYCTASGSDEVATPAPFEAAKENVPAGGKAKHVLLVVWDGLRPDFVRDDTTPALAKMAREGTFFAKHHSIYPTSTEVNGTALATGCFPQHSGIIGNREYRPEIDPTKPIDTQNPAIIRKGDELTGGKYLAVPTLPEILQQAGRRVVVAGTKPVAWLMNRSPTPSLNAETQCVSVVEGESIPTDSAVSATTLQGHFPKTEHFPNLPGDTWTRQALVDVLWKDGVPPMSVLWLSEPDYSQHKSGIGSEMALGGLASSDAQFSAALAALSAKGVAGETDVIVVSDHGFSTITQALDLKRTLVEAGFPAHDRYARAPRSGDILLDNLGGSVFLYVAEHDQAMIKRLAEFLQNSPFAGPIFTRDGLPGTFPLSLVHIASSQAPDVVLAMRWNEERNSVGAPGGTISCGDRSVGQGTHATLSPHDIHNTCVAAGPDFRCGYTADLPSSNVDIAPTIAWILGSHSPGGMDGRILKNALIGFPTNHPADSPQTQKLTATADLAAGQWQQYLQVTRYDGESYLDEGNGSMTPSKP